MRLKTVTAVSLLLLVLNAGYIWAFASPTIFYMGNVLAHLVIGLMFCVTGLALLARDADLRQRLPIRLAALALAVALGLGSYLTVKGNVMELRWALQAHIAASILGVLAIVAFAWRQRLRGGVAAWRFSAALQAAAVFLVVLPVSAALWTRSHPNPHDRIVNPSVPPLTA